MLSHRVNVASIVSRRVELAGLVDLIKAPIGSLIKSTSIGSSGRYLGIESTFVI